jgi:hypothetical protein
MATEALSFIDALCAGGRTDDRTGQRMLCGQFVVHGVSGERSESTCEMHFAWTLGGRAVQDVWLVPSRYERSGRRGRHDVRSTLRIYDPDTDQWQILCADPVRQTIVR